ncbi:MAG: L,D-transpeptidase family protein [Clostridiales bacterium]|nr:L,D-transpeptidase family protein [Clostridiales bacterium]
MRNHSLKESNIKQTAVEVKPLFIIFGLILLLLLSYILISLYYNTHFYMKTTINGTDTSNMTVEQADEAIQAEFKSYSLKLEGKNNLSSVVHGEDFELHSNYDGKLEDLLDTQNSFLWPIALFNNSNLEITTQLEYDEDLLKDLILSLTFFRKEYVVEPVDAYISDYKKGTGYEIIPEVSGTQLDFELLFVAIKDTIDNLEPSLSLEEADTYLKPKVTSKSPKLIQAVEELNKIAGAEIIYAFGKDTEVLDGNKISEWLSISENGNVVLDESGVKEYVDYIGKTYNSFGRTRSFKTSYGVEIKVKGGDYGWWLNRPLEVTELTELILAGEKRKKKPAYHQTAQQYGDDDIGNTYVEVNLTAQHLFFYRAGKLIMESDFVSGNLSKGYGTPTGTYPIKHKGRNATLNGEDYSTPVDYWLPFNLGIGFHDAPWRKEFGGDIYKTKGSHGCINMPPEQAKIMFENIDWGVAVVVYELPAS